MVSCKGKRGCEGDSVTGLAAKMSTHPLENVKEKTNVGIAVIS